MIFVHVFRKKRQQSYDPVNLETLDDLVDWVMEDSPPFLTNEEVDALRKDLANRYYYFYSFSLFIF